MRHDNQWLVATFGILYTIVVIGVLVLHEYSFKITDTDVIMAVAPMLILTIIMTTTWLKSKA